MAPLCLDMASPYQILRKKGECTVCLNVFMIQSVLCSCVGMLSLTQRCLLQKHCSNLRCGPTPTDHKHSIAGAQLPSHMLDWTSRSVCWELQALQADKTVDKKNASLCPKCHMYCCLMCRTHQGNLVQPHASLSCKPLTCKPGCKPELPTLNLG